MRYNVLVLDAQGVFSKERKCTIDYVEFLQRYAPGDHNFLYHNIYVSNTSVLKQINFHVIVLTYSALSLRYLRPRDRYYRIRDVWSFIGDLDAIKLAFPQDDYHNTMELDLLFRGLGVDIIYSVVPKHMEIFYPLSKRSCELKGVLTGYIDDNSIAMMKQFNKSFEDREVDIFHRVRMYNSYGAFCGYHARIKGRMANRFRKVAIQRGVKIDISTRPEDIVYGDRWLERLGNSRFSIGCEGGVSLWDPEGRYQDLVFEYVKAHGDVSFREVESTCFPGQDGRHVFSVVSPRLFESAMMGCSQVLVEGEYLGLLVPWEHYIPVRFDLSDVDMALDAMRDVDAAKRRIAACQETLVENPALRYSTLAKEVMADIERLSIGRGFKETDSRKFMTVVADHKTELRSWMSWKECQPKVDLPRE